MPLTQACRNYIALALPLNFLDLAKKVSEDPELLVRYNVISRINNIMANKLALQNSKSRFENSKNVHQSSKSIKTWQTRYNDSKNLSKDY